jgi:hypothetical protein
MRETLLVITARNITGPLLAEMARWLGSTFVSPEPDDADEFLRQVWQEVGDDLRGAMRQYPLQQAATDAGYSLSSSPA